MAIDGWAQLVHTGKHHFYHKDAQWSLCSMPRPTDHLNFVSQDFLSNDQMCKTCRKKFLANRPWETYHQEANLDVENRLHLKPIAYRDTNGQLRRINNAFKPEETTRISRKAKEEQS